MSVFGSYVYFSKVAKNSNFEPVCSRNFRQISPPQVTSHSPFLFLQGILNQTLRGFPSAMTLWSPSGLRGLPASGRSPAAQTLFIAGIGHGVGDTFRLSAEMLDIQP